MKFPKEKARLLYLVQEALEEDDYFSIYKLKDEMFGAFGELKNTTIFDSLLHATFQIAHFDGIILISDELMKKDYESWDLIYYTLLAFLANQEIYQAMLFIKRNGYLNSTEYGIYHGSEGANYSNILHLDVKNHSLILALIMTNFMEGLAKEMLGDMKIDQEYHLYRMFDLLNLIYELGYPLEFITKLTEVMKIIYSIEM